MQDKIQLITIVGPLALSGEPNGAQSVIRRYIDNASDHFREVRALSNFESKDVSLSQKVCAQYNLWRAINGLPCANLVHWHSNSFLDLVTLSLCCLTRPSCLKIVITFHSPLYNDTTAPLFILVKLIDIFSRTLMIHSMNHKQHGTFCSLISPPRVLLVNNPPDKLSSSNLYASSRKLSRSQLIDMLKREYALKSDFPSHSNIVVVSSLSSHLPKKNVAKIIESLQYLPPGFVLILSGSGPNTTKLKNLVNSLGLSGRVGFHKYISDRSFMHLYLKSIDVYVHASTLDVNSLILQDIILSRLLTKLVVMRSSIYRYQIGELLDALSFNGSARDLADQIQLRANGSPSLRLDLQLELVRNQIDFKLYPMLAGSIDS